MNISQPKDTHIPLLRNLWKEAFADTDAFLDTFFTTAFSPERCRCLLIDDIPVAALYWFNCEYKGHPVAYLYAIATAVSHRGQGLCKQLMQDTHKHLASLGYQGALLVPGGAGLFSFYETLGYKTTCHIREFTCTSAMQNFTLRQISSENYASLRRSFLPSGGVIQEDENLAFLQTEGIFYAGEGFLLVAKIVDNRLYGIELLGNTDLAPGLVHYFKCTEGFFRTPGQDKPFAMYLTFNNTRQALPSYLGFAYD